MSKKNPLLADVERRLGQDALGGRKNGSCTEDVELPKKNPLIADAERRVLVALGDFDESKVNREGGKFAKKAGGGKAKKKKGSAREEAQKRKEKIRKKERPKMDKREAKRETSSSSVASPGQKSLVKSVANVGQNMGLPTDTFEQDGHQVTEIRGTVASDVKKLLKKNKFSVKKKGDTLVATSPKGSQVFIQQKNGMTTVSSKDPGSGSFSFAQDDLMLDVGSRSDYNTGGCAKDVKLPDPEDNPLLADVDKRVAVAAGNFDESKVNRDSGKFAPKGGGSGSSKKKSGGTKKQGKFTVPTGSWSGKASGKDIRQSFLKKIGAQGRSKKQHLGGLAVGDDKVQHVPVSRESNAVFGKGAVGLKGGKDLKDAAMAYAKARGFKKVATKGGYKHTTYQDDHGNQIMFANRAQGKKSVYFNTAK